MSYRGTESHNMYATLEIPTNPRHKIFISMIKGLRECPLAYAISANPPIYSSWVNEFWENSKTAVDQEGNPIITSKVAGKDVSITEEDIRRVLQIKDSPASLAYKFRKEILGPRVTNMGYETQLATFDKKFMPPYWKYLFHIIAQGLSNLKGGFDSLRLDWVGIMVSLVDMVDYNFSRFFFNIMHTHALSIDNKWALYPRFVQLLLDDKLPDVAKPVQEPSDDKDVPKEPHHAGLIKRSVFNSLLNPVGRSYRYQNKVPWMKLGRFAETEPPSDKDEPANVFEPVAPESDATESEVEVPLLESFKMKTSATSRLAVDEPMQQLKRIRKVGSQHGLPKIKYNTRTQKVTQSTQTTDASTVSPTDTSLCATSPTKPQPPPASSKSMKQHVVENGKKRKRDIPTDTTSKQFPTQPTLSTKSPLPPPPKQVKPASPPKQAIPPPLPTLESSSLHIIPTTQLVLYPNPLSVSMPVRSPVTTDPLLRRIVALEEANRKRIDRDAKLVEFIKTLKQRVAELEADAKTQRQKVAELEAEVKILQQQTADQQMKAISLDKKSIKQHSVIETQQMTISNQQLTIDIQKTVIHDLKTNIEKLEKAKEIQYKLIEDLKENLKTMNEFYGKITDDQDKELKSLKTKLRVIFKGLERDVEDDMPSKKVSSFGGDKGAGHSRKDNPDIGTVGKEVEKEKGVTEEEKVVEEEEEDEETDDDSNDGDDNTGGGVGNQGGNTESENPNGNGNHYFSIEDRMTQEQLREDELKQKYIDDQFKDLFDD